MWFLSLLIFSHFQILPILPTSIYKQVLLPSHDAA